MRAGKTELPCPGCRPPRSRVLTQLPDAELEAWVLDIADRVKSGQHIEDSRIELKSQWPDPVQSARQLAGHLNASRGSDVLWLIGLHERRGVEGVPSGETSAWLAQVRAQFDEMLPTLAHDLAVPYGEGLTIVALLFESDCAPYVVKNPAAGQGGPIAREVPWREGTAVRTATRADLLRLLVPLVLEPRVEALSAMVHVEQESTCKTSSWSMNVTAYCRSDVEATVIIPWHQVSAWFTFEDSGEVKQATWAGIEGHATSAGGRFSHGAKITVATIHTGSDQVMITGPGRMYLKATRREPLPDPLPDYEGRSGVVTFEWTAVDSEQIQRLHVPMAYRPWQSGFTAATPPEGLWASWVIKR